MSWLQPGHLTQRPSGTRLGFSAVEEAIGFRVFLNQAIWGYLVREERKSQNRVNAAIRSLARSTASRGPSPEPVSADRRARRRSPRDRAETFQPPATVSRCNERRSAGRPH